MAHDEILADRVRDVLAGEPGLSERKMFGGLAFMFDGHMCCGLVGDRLMLGLGADETAKALRLPYVAPMDFTGRPMSGMVYVAADGVRGRALRPWMVKATAFVRTLPPKRPPRLSIPPDDVRRRKRDSLSRSAWTRGSP